MMDVLISTGEHLETPAHTRLTVVARRYHTAWSGAKELMMLVCVKGHIDQGVHVSDMQPFDVLPGDAV